MSENCECDINAARNVSFLEPNYLQYLRCLLLFLIEKYNVDLSVAHKELAGLYRSEPGYVYEALAVSIINHHDYALLFRDLSDFELKELNKWHCLLQNVKSRRGQA